MNKLEPQRPTNPENWLHNRAQDWQRIFSKLVYLGKDAEPWAECTNEEKEAWEAEHPQPELPEPPEPPEQENE